MADAVRLRPNHYETLGLTQGASSDEIAQAFARELNQLPLRPFGSFAQVSVAYETLRDPLKRKAYDATLRPKKEPEPAQSLIGRLESRPFMAAPPMKVATVSHVAPAPEPLAQPRMAPSATALLRQSPKPDVAGTPIRPPHRQAPEPAAHVDDAAPRWKLPAIAAGALALAVAVGAWTGWAAGNDNAQAQIDPADILTESPAKALPAVDQSPAEPVAEVVEAQPKPGTREAVAKPKSAQPRPALQIDLPAEPPAQTEVQSEEIATEQAVADAPEFAPTAARMPLSNAMIARTIGRIGYPCGQVASTAAVDGGESGVFRVTCTSGHTYRAAPLRGRYHFRRIGGG